MLGQVAQELEADREGARGAGPHRASHPPGAQARRRLRPAGRGAPAARARRDRIHQHAGAHRTGYRDAVSVPAVRVGGTRARRMVELL